MIEQMLLERGFTAMPVVDGGKLVGIISRQHVRRIGEPEGLNSPVKADMSTTVQTPAPHASPLQAARLTIKYDIGRLPQVQQGQRIGIASRSDTMRYFCDLWPG